MINRLQNTIYKRLDKIGDHSTPYRWVILFPCLLLLKLLLIPVGRGAELEINVRISVTRKTIKTESEADIQTRAHLEPDILKDLAKLELQSLRQQKERLNNFLRQVSKQRRI